MAEAIRLVVASANPDKVAEIAAILEPAGVLLVPRPPGVADVVEDADTLEGNARLKAVAIAEAAGAPAVADDTGLEVDALDGAPGVRSARYAGERVTYADNVAHLLAELDRAGATTAAQRRARFRTVAMVRWPDGTELVAEGVVQGHISVERRGEAGFGYDPVFVPDRVAEADTTDSTDSAESTERGEGRTFAQMTAAEKHALSHRGRAFRALAAALAGL